MLSETADAGLRLDQAPPLSLPLSFFLTAPCFMVAAGLLLLWAGPSMVLSRYLLGTIAFTHLGTLGVLAMVMFGALYQMTPVVAASPVPALWLARVVHAALLLGAATLAGGVVTQTRPVLFVAFGALGVAWLGFVLPVGLALWRSAAAADATVRGMRIALGCLLWLGVLGLWMAHGHAGLRFPGPRPLWMGVHLALGLLGWIGALITAVSFQVLPMFYLTPPLAAVHKRWLLHAVVGSAVLASAVLCASALLRPELAQHLALWASYAFVPAALAVWGFAPLLTLRAIAARKRKRSDASLRFWIAGLGCAPLLLLLGGANLVFSDPRLELGFGWLALFGWALFIVHGMLYRIVPFLVWFHRLSHLVGYVPVPSVAKLLPERWPRIAFALHAALVLSGACAIALRSGALARLTGLLLVLLAAQLLRSLAHLTRYRAPVVLAGDAVRP
ncbi:MAG TPA: hypothetical protein VF331_04680 [Polyangiales bacterium]